MANIITEDTVVLPYRVGVDGHSPYIGENGNWYQWSPTERTYIDTGVTALSITFTPIITIEGLEIILSWENGYEYPTPAPVNVRGRDVEFRLNGSVLEQRIVGEETWYTIYSFLSIEQAEATRVQNEINRGSAEEIRKLQEGARQLTIAGWVEEFENWEEAETTRWQNELLREQTNQEMVAATEITVELNTHPPVLQEVSGRQIWHYWDIVNDVYVSTGLPGAFNFVSNDLVSYQKYDVVQINGTSYISLIDDNTSPIQEGTNWKTIAKVGRTPQFEIGTITTTEEGTQATVTIALTGYDIDQNPQYTVDYSIPRGNTGKSAYDVYEEGGGTLGEEAFNTLLSSIETVITDAELATNLANEIATHPPVITNGTWYYWNASTNAYVDSDIAATPYESYLQNTTDDPPLTEAQWSLWSKEQGDYAKEQGDYAKDIGDTYDAAKVSKTVLETTEEVIAQSLVDLKERIDALEELIKQGILNNIIIKTLSVEDFQMNGASLILTGANAPTVTPDFIGQFYIKTTATTACYQSTGISAVGDWKQIG